MCSVRYAAVLALAAASVQAPTGTMAGRILDKDGNPYIRALVQAVAVVFQDGREILVPVAQAESDAEGEFRIEGVPAGRYLVSASDPSPANVLSDATGPLRYPPTYFPGVLQAERAKRVTVTAGSAPARVEFRLQLVRPSGVSGVIRTEDGRPLVNGAVVMTAEENGVRSAVPPEDVTILPDGAFSFRNVPPGRYQIRARGETEPQGVSLFATFSLSVDAHDVRNLRLILTPGGSVEGRVVIDPDAKAQHPGYSGMRVRAPFADGTSFGDAPTGDVLSDGTFRIRGVMSGTHCVDVEGLRAPWVLKSVMHRGQELVDVPFDVARGERLRDMRITLTNVATEVQGTARTPGGSPALGAIVIVLPASSQFWSKTSPRLRITRTDADGRFLVRGLPAGQYRAFASLDVDEAEAYRPDVLRRAAADGVPLSLAQGETRTLDLALAGVPGR
jgi:hypothetical protein